MIAKKIARGGSYYLSMLKDENFIKDICQKYSIENMNRVKNLRGC